MPRIIHKRHLIRIPVPADIAYDVTYYYNPEGDREISLKHVERLLVGTENQKGLAKHFLSSIQGKYELTIKQRLCLLQMEFPRDLRLKAIRACIEKANKKFEARFRADPHAVYLEEGTAISRALRDLECERKILATVG